MKTITFKIALLAILSCSMFFISCQKTYNYTTGGSATEDIGEILSTGTCTAFGVTSSSARMCYKDGLYYLDYFYDGDGSFAFKWDKSTNGLSIVNYYTGITNGFYPIEFLDQKDYEDELGDKAVPSIYNPSNNTFTFEVLFQTAVEGDQIVRGITEIIYTPESSD